MTRQDDPLGDFGDIVRPDSFRGQKREKIRRGHLPLDRRTPSENDQRLPNEHIRNFGRPRATIYKGPQFREAPSSDTF